MNPTNGRRREVLRGALALLTVLALALPAQAQSGRQTTPDGQQVLVNKLQGGLQWAIGLNPYTGAATGNVFDPTGAHAPQFVWCDRAGDNGVFDASAVEITFQCYGSDPCMQSPCTPDDQWVDLGQPVLPGSFFLPARDPFLPLQRPGAGCDTRFIQSEPIAGEPSYEAVTTLCPYFTVQQSSLVAIQPGDQIFIRMWHWPLATPAGGQHRIAIQVGERIVWQETIPIPAQTGLLFPCVTADFSADAGTPVYWHIEHYPAVGSATATADDHALVGLERPMHSPPDTYNLIELNVGGCGEGVGTPLVNPNLWQLVSTALP